MFTNIIGLLFLASVPTTPVMALSVPRNEPPAPVTQTILPKDFSSITTIRQYVIEQAIIKGVDVELVDKIVKCESGYFAQQSQYKDPTGPNGREDSWGIFQWNLKHNPHITREQAMDIEWSTEYSLEQIKSGFKSWSCWPK